jgi:hypothetical protein
MQDAYFEIAVGKFSNRNIIIPTTKLIDFVKKCQEDNSELYRSYYYYDQTILDHLKIHASVRGFAGTRYLMGIFLDLDKDAASDTALLARGRIVVERLLSQWKLKPEHIRISFSGRGYHIGLPNIFGFQASPELPGIVDATLKKHFPEADAIYDGPRLFRVNGTINLKSGLYKIPLLFEEFMDQTPDEIKDLAKEPRVLTLPVIPEVITYFTEQRVLTAKSIAATLLKETPHLQAQPTNVITCVQKMYNQGPQSGTRHQLILRMASAWRRQGLPQDATLNALVLWAKDLPREEVQKITDYIYSKNISYGCHDEKMVEYCDPKCIFYAKKNISVSGGVATAEEMSKSFTDFVRRDFGETSFDLANVWRTPSYKFYPGEFNIVIGDTKLGKTAWVQNLLVPLKKLRVLYLSTELHQNLVYRRFIQIAHNMSKDQVFLAHKEGSSELFRAISHIEVKTTSPHIKQMRQLVIDRQPQLVVIDVLDGIIPEFKRKDPIEEIGLELRAIATELDVIIIGVNHISKSAAQDEHGKQRLLTVHSGKGASTLEQKADKVIGIEGDRQSRLRTVTAIASRDETEIVLKYMFAPETFVWTQL